MRDELLWIVQKEPSGNTLHFFLRSTAGDRPLSSIMLGGRSFFSLQIHVENRFEEKKREYIRIPNVQVPNATFEACSYWRFYILQ